MSDGTIIKKEINYYSRYMDNNIYKTNHYEINIDDIEPLRLMNSAVDLSDGKICARFYYTDSTAEFFEGNEQFSLGSQHKISLLLYNDDSSVKRYLVENEIFTIKEKNMSLICSECKAIQFEIVLEASCTQ